MELNASDERGIDVVREQIKGFASAQTIFGNQLKLIILDEADQLTKDAQAALRRVIEKYTKNCRFCMICNYVNRIIPALQSRCMRFRFAPLHRTQVVDRLKAICQKENVEFDEKGIARIYQLSRGDMRKCVHILQSTHMSYDKITEDNVYLCTGHPTGKDIQLMLQTMLNKDFDEALRKVDEIKTQKGLALQDMITDMSSLFMKVQVPTECKVFALEQLSNIEHRASFGTSEKLQLSALVGVCQIVRQCITQKKPIAELISDYPVS